MKKIIVLLLFVTTLFSLFKMMKVHLKTTKENGYLPKWRDDSKFSNDWLWYGMAEFYLLNANGTFKKSRKKMDL
jgi:hypothetical protein